MDTKQDTITEADVIAWLAAKTQKLSDLCGREYARISVSTLIWGYKEAPPEYNVIAYVHAVPEGVTIMRNSVDDAVSTAVIEVSKDHRAANLRHRAAELMKQADELEGKQ